MDFEPEYVREEFDNTIKYIIIIGRCNNIVLYVDTESLSIYINFEGVISEDDFKTPFKLDENWETLSPEDKERYFNHTCKTVLEYLTL